MKADQILRQAADVIEERGKLRDKPDGERSMWRAVEAFNALTGNRMSELEGWLFMSVLKIARGTAGEPHLDDFTDLAGYAALAAECVSETPSEGNDLAFSEAIRNSIVQPDGSVGGIDTTLPPGWKNGVYRIPTQEEIIAAGPRQIHDRPTVNLSRCPAGQVCDYCQRGVGSPCYAR